MRKSIPKILFISFLACMCISCIIRSASNIEMINTKEPLIEEPLVYSATLDFTSMILCIFEDSKGNYWFGSDRGGVCKYDGKKFTYFSSSDGLESNQIRTIQEDQDGNIWFATGYGVNKYDGKTISTPKAKKISSASAPVLNG